LDDLKVATKKERPWMREDDIDDCIKSYGEGFIKIAAFFNGHEPIKT
jgi:hypothetical protein